MMEGELADGKIAYRHTNINSKDWRKLSLFYQHVFGCVPVGPERDLQGEWIDQITGVEGVHIQGQHLALPGYEAGGPTFEIFTYNIPGNTHSAPINGYGFAHVAFEVDDVPAVFDLLLRSGGSSCGSMLKHYYPSLDRTLHIVYAQDPEGNVVEIMKWTDGDVADKA
jgi:predicted enzyme related to lactoylglutathione lyase